MIKKIIGGIMLLSFIVIIFACNVIVYGLAKTLWRAMVSIVMFSLIFGGIILLLSD